MHRRKQHPTANSGRQQCCSSVALTRGSHTTTFCGLVPHLSATTMEQLPSMWLAGGAWWLAHCLPTAAALPRAGCDRAGFTTSRPGSSGHE